MAITFLDKLKEIYRATLGLFIVIGVFTPCAYALPIGAGYEKYFTKAELDSSVILGSDWFVRDTILR